MLVFAFAMISLYDHKSSYKINITLLVRSSLYAQNKIEAGEVRQMNAKERFAQDL